MSELKKIDDLLNCTDCVFYPTECRNYMHRKFRACSEYKEVKTE
jgi:hypothetical protein